MANTVRMDMTAACLSFPEPPEQEIQRDNITDAIEIILGGTVSVVVLEGAEGMGKTTLLAQFSKKHPNNTISLFVRPTNKWAYDPDRLRWDLCNQLEWTLHHTEIKEWDTADYTFLRNRLTHLQRRIRQTGVSYYVVVDGLDQIPDESGELRQVVLDMLPFGSGFKFLFSSCPDRLTSSIPKGVDWKPFTLPGFGYDETLRYFSDLNLAPDFVSEIYHACKKTPAHLASVRRLIQSGVDLTNDDLPNQLRHLYELEWRAVDTSNDTLLTLMAILSHDRNDLTISDLAKVTGYQTADVKNLLSGISFVKIDAERGDRVSFVTDAFRRFSAEQLKHLKTNVNDLLIAHLMKDPTSDEALTNLPGYLDQANRHVELLQYLSPDTFAEMLGKSQSLSLVEQKADLGILAASKNGKDADLIRFAIQRSSMTDLADMTVYESEVEARIALGDYGSAVALAHSAMLKENRLRLLALVAKRQLAAGLAPQPELNEQIRQLYSQIDPARLGGAGARIAKDLLHSNPDLALDLVEKASQVKGQGVHSLDWALASLSIAASRMNNQSDRDQMVTKMRNRIKNPDALRASTEGSLLFGDYNPAKVIEQIETLEKVSDRIYLLRGWVGHNTEAPGAADVVQYALDTIIKTTEYTPNATVFRELAMALPFVPDEARARHLVGLFTSQIGGIETLGPTEDLVWLNTLLARTEWKYDREVARSRLADVYLTVAELNELGVKVGCLARLVQCLTTVDPDRELEITEGLHTLAEDDLHAALAQLLDATADQFYATREVIKALATTKPDTVLELAMRLNTEPRRDAALLEVLAVVTEVPNQLDMEFLIRVLNSFADPDLRDTGLITMLMAIDVHPNPSDAIVDSLLPLIQANIKEIRNANDRCLACCIAYAILARNANPKHGGLLEHLLRMLKLSWDAIDVGWVKVEVGFSITEAFARILPEKAKEYLERTEQDRRDLLVDDESTALICVTTVQLAIRAFAGLLPRNLDLPEDLEQLRQLIQRIPSNGVKAQVWGELAVRCYLAGRRPLCEDIVVQHVKPLIGSISPDDTDFASKTVVLLAPALFCAHRPTALEMISGLPSDQKDAAVMGICAFLMQKVSPMDPYEPGVEASFDISYEDCIDICELMEHIDVDVSISYLCQCIAESVLRRRHDRFSQQQLANISNRLTLIINKKLPNSRYIKHNGFKIVASAYVARILNVKGQTWDDLISQARTLPNTADRAFVLAILATAFRDTQRRQDLIKEALELVDQIPSSYDKIERYRHIAEELFSVDKHWCQETLRRAMQVTYYSDNPELYPSQRKIVDVAYRISPSFASSLAALVDDDPARGAARTRLSRDLETLELRQRMIDGASTKNDQAEHRVDYGQAAWRSLAYLNAGLASHIHLESTREYIEAAARLPVAEAYPVFAWAVQNAVNRYANTDQARSILRPLFDATFMAAQMASRMAGRTFQQFERSKFQVVNSSNEDGLVVRPGDREKALGFIREWFETQVRDYVKICDPYFGPQDLEILQLLRSVVPKCKVRILTSQHNQEKEGLSYPWSDSYRDHWRTHVSAQNPPDTEIVIVGTKTGGFPIHDRWWVSVGTGIRLGTSFKSLGLTQDSQIGLLSPVEVTELESEVDRYLDHIEREHNGEKLNYSMFEL